MMIVKKHGDTGCIMHPWSVVGFLRSLQPYATIKHIDRGYFGGIRSFILELLRAEWNFCARGYAGANKLTVGAIEYDVYIGEWFFDRKLHFLLEKLKIPGSFPFFSQIDKIPALFPCSRPKFQIPGFSRPPGTAGNHDLIQLREQNKLFHTYLL